MSESPSIDEAIQRIRELGGRLPQQEAPEPLEAVSINGSARLRVEADGTVTVTLSAGSVETAQAGVQEALTELLQHYERRDDELDLDMPDFEGQLSRLTGEIGAGFERMRADLDRILRRTRD